MTCLEKAGERLAGEWRGDQMGWGGTEPRRDGIKKGAKRERMIKEELGTQ